jgi:hypothetical protein
MAHGRRCVGGIGSGGRGGGGVGWLAACPHAAQGGFFVRPSKGLGSVERLRLHGGGTGSTGG